MIVSDAADQPTKISPTMTHEDFEAKPSLVVIGGSAGGIGALSDLLSFLPENLSAVVIAVIHRNVETESYLKELLERHSGLPVVIPKNGDRLRQGVCYIGRPQMHLTVAPGMCIRLVPDGFYRAHTIDALFTSAARHADGRLLGVVLSGTQKDGTEGLIAIKEAGGIAFVQNPEGASFPEMPLNALKNVPVDFIGDLKGLAEQIRKRVEAWASTDCHRMNAALDINPDSNSEAD